MQSAYNDPKSKHTSKTSYKYLTGGHRILDYFVGVQCVTNNKFLTHQGKVLTMKYCQTLQRQDVFKEKKKKKTDKS